MRDQDKRQTTQDQLAVEKLRANLDQEKSDLSDQGKQIKELKNSISVAQSTLIPSKIHQLCKLQDQSLKLPTHLSR